jgi:hypothetical protein
MVKCAKKKKKAVERKKKGLDRASIVRDGRFFDLSGYAQSQLDKVALRLNQRPRKTLGFETPASRLRASVAPTH